MLPTSPELALQVLQSAGIGVAVIASGRPGLPLLTVDDAFAQLAGRPAADLAGALLVDLVAAPAGSPGAPEALAAAVADGRSWTGVVVVGRPARHVEIAAAPLPGGARATLVARDAQAQAELRERLALVEGRYGRVIDDLAAAELRYRELVERIPAVIYIAEYREGWPLRYVSPQIETLTGHPPRAFIDDNDLWYRLIHDDDRQTVLDAEANALVDPRPLDLEYRMRGSDGAMRWVSERDEIIRDADGRPLFTQGVIVDITAQRRAEERMRRERDRAQSYLDLTRMLVVVLDPEGRIELLNRAGHELLGRDDGELVGRDYFETCVAPEQREQLRARFADIVAGAEPPVTDGYEAQLVTADGDVRIVSWNTSVLRDRDGRVTSTLSSGVDVTARRRAERQIVHLAYHDSLTGLPNRALLREHLDLALARARRNDTAVALLYLDLDDFKLVNDSLGHAAGDDLLRRVAGQLRLRVRASDLLVRQGGDEFLLLLSDLDRAGAPEAARSAAASVRAALAEPFELAGAEFHIGASVGISLFPQDAEDAETLLKHADGAMYRAKGAGRGEIALYAREAAEPAERLSLSTRLRRGIAEDELVLHWQPIVALADGEVLGAEALVRWQHPERGLLTPAQFIPFAEETGLIDRLGAWVADAVGSQRAAWRADGLEPAVHLNVSPRQLARPGFAGDLVARVGAGGVTVEITESPALRDDRGAAARALRELAEAGVRIAIDDFGAGWSSLARLRRLPVHAVKVDSSLLAGVPATPEPTAILTALRGLVDALGLDAVAEGVETEHQRDFLAREGWPAAQGFLLGAPAPAAALTGRLRTGG